MLEPVQNHACEGYGDRLIFNQMVEYSLDLTFAALTDPTRRAILKALSDGESSVGGLAAPFDVSFQAVSKHIGVLADAGLVEREKQGRVQVCRLVPAPLREADAWIGDYRAFWEEKLDSFERFLRR
jgi:DNA-binding transcriptional ArsR family regulator